MEQLNKLSPMAHWLPRLSLAGTFFYHGLPKFVNAPGMAESMGFPVIFVYLLALAETLAALFIIIGGIGPDWATRISGALIAAVMAGAIVLVHWPHGWNSVNTGSGNMGRGMEFQVLMLALGIFFLINGNRVNNLSSGVKSKNLS